MNPGCRVIDQLSTNEPTAPYIIGRELNLRKLPGRQWESNPQPSEQLRPTTIKTSASTETATTDIFQRMTTLRNLYLLTLTYYFKEKNVKLYSALMEMILSTWRFSNILVF